MLRGLYRNYPRSRGEKRAFPTRRKARTELPPLARGKVICAERSVWVGGITPARAGKSYSRLESLWGLWNYPRSRGEKYSGITSRGSVTELPPLARGKEHPTWTGSTSRGITPARAGKSFLRCLGCECFGNYPRSRGEKSRKKPPKPLYLELPPLARGKGQLNQNAPQIRGITPARAGKRKQWGLGRQ